MSFFDAIIGALAAYLLWDDHRALAWVAVALVAMQLVLPLIAGLVLTALGYTFWEPEADAAPRGRPVPRWFRLFLNAEGLVFGLVLMGLVVYGFVG